jgi:hypothetical protein
VELRDADAVRVAVVAGAAFFTDAQAAEFEAQMIAA